MAIADRIVFAFDPGVIVQEGPPTALYNEPATLFAAEFMGSNNRLDGTLVEEFRAAGRPSNCSVNASPPSARNQSGGRKSDRNHPRIERVPVVLQARAPTG